MEHLRQAATLLYAILSDMDKIPVEGLDKQKTFLGCADGIRTAAQVILQYVQEKNQKAVPVTNVNGTASVVENINTEEEVNGR